MRGPAILTLVLMFPPVVQEAYGASATTATIQAQDNRTAAGSLRDGVLRLELEIEEGLWQAEHPLAANPVLAFREARGPLTIPGPLIRVRQGTALEVTIHNRHGRDIFVRGLQARRKSSRALRVPARGRATATFQADLVGTYYYWGTLKDSLNKREGLDSQLTGAFIVDPPSGAENDRVFVIGRLGSANDGVNVGSGLGAWVINGQSWPDTERLTYRVGEPVTWRWINATGHRHPLHLHGTYFQVTHKGDNARDAPHAEGRRHLVVTEVMQPGTTMAMTWSPARPGNWLFHCHNLFHVMPDNRLPVPKWYEEYAELPHDQHMAGLVLGVHALPAASSAIPPDGMAPRGLTLRIGERPAIQFETTGLRAPGLGYAVDGGPVTAPGPVIVLDRGRPVEITIVNGIKHATAVHWHGIELESYYDGVPHWGGDSRQVTPHIAPGETFVARFTPPRAGTFIYHTHFNDYIQLTTGLYGALLVKDPGPADLRDDDPLFVISQGGLDDQKDPVLLNGTTDPPPLTLRSSRRYRLRLVGITASLSARVRLLRHGRVVTWRPLAKDGADLPETLAVSCPAEIEIFPGETYDFELALAEPGPLQLEAVLQRASSQRATGVLLVEP
jgi:FtsP/CotA-like multicopper oxidase with cupredoxin domain